MSTKKQLRAMLREAVRAKGYGRGYRLNVKTGKDWDEADGAGWEGWKDTLKDIEPACYIVIPQGLLGRLEGIPLDHIEVDLREVSDELE